MVKVVKPARWLVTILSNFTAAPCTNEKARAVGTSPNETHIHGLSPLLECPVRCIRIVGPATHVADLIPVQHRGVSVERE